MADLSSDIRLAVDSGTTAIGMKSVFRSIRQNKAKLVVAATNAEEGQLQEVNHIAKITGVEVVKFKGTPVDLGAVCGKPFSVSMLSIIEPGNSKILESAKEPKSE